MKSLTLILTLLTFVLSGCNTLKETQVNVASGDYEQAIRNSVENLRKSRSKKKSSEYILLLEEAFAKAVERDERSLERIKLEHNGNALEERYRIYENLSWRQEYIRPLLPLHLPEQGRDAHFPLVNYSRHLVESKNRLSRHLYDHATELLDSEDKLNARLAYEKLKYLNNINPSFEDTISLMNEAHFQGTDFVLVKIVNASETALPQRLEDDLLDFQASELNNRNSWSVYHNSYVENIEYDFELVLAIDRILVSPERIHEKEIVREKRIKDGFNYQLDKNGNVAKDANGNEIKKDHYITVRSVVAEFTQSKSALVEGKVEFRPFQSRETLSSFPLASEYVFEHHFCTHHGDTRALTDHDRSLLEQAIIPFPSNEQMIYDSGQDLKNRLKETIADNRF